MTTRKPCVNVPTATYSGKEQSPLHFGLSAEGYDLNTVLEGYDHMMWSAKMKNGRKVWIRNMPVGPGGVIHRMVHEEPVIAKKDVIVEGAVDPQGPQGQEDQEVPESQEAKVTQVTQVTKVTKVTKVSKATKEAKPEINEIIETKPVSAKPAIMKPVVEEKKITDYNLFLTFRLFELKKEKPSDKTNKELFNQAVAEWKELKKNAAELKKTIQLAKEFSETSAAKN